MNLKENLYYKIAGEKRDWEEVDRQNIALWGKDPNSKSDCFLQETRMHPCSPGFCNSRKSHSKEN